MEEAIDRQPLLIDEDVSIFEAISLLCANACKNCILVRRNQQLVGIITDQDLVELIATGRDLAELQVSEVMRTPIITFRTTEYTDLSVPLNLCQQHGICYLPLLDELDTVVGLLTCDHLRQLLHPLELLKVRLTSEAMVSGVIRTLPHTSMWDLAQLMTQHQVNAVLVVAADNNLSPIGIVTRGDILQGLLLGLDLAATPAQRVMNTPIFSVREDDSLWTAHILMQQQKIQQVAVIDHEHQLLGIITQRSLLNVFNSMEIFRVVESLQRKVLLLEEEQLALLKARNHELEKQLQEQNFSLQLQARRERLLSKIVMQIRSSLNLQEILNTTNLQTILDTTVREVCSFLMCDRIVIYQFDTHGGGTIIAESVEPGWSSSLHTRMEDACFQGRTALLYGSGRTIAIDNIYTAGYTDCHIKSLEQYQVKANMVAPILVSGQPWGLLIAHQCQDHRSWQSVDLNFLNEVAVQLAVAIQQAISYQQAQAELVERQRTEVMLRQSEERFASLALSAPVGIFRIDSLGKFSYVNNHLCEIVGLSADQLVGMDWFTGISLEDRQTIIQEWQKSVQHNYVFSLECRYLQPNGTKVWILSKAEAELDAQGNTVSYIGTLTNINERKQAEQALQQLNQELEIKVAQRTEELQESRQFLLEANDRLSITNTELTRATRLKDEFLANMSHELRTPLNAILGISEGLQDRVYGEINEKQQKSIATVERSGRHLLELINDILEVSKIEAGQFELTTSPVAINHLCNSSLPFIKQQAMQKGIRLTLSCPADLGEIMIDERRMRQVLINLLSNAIKFTPPGGQVKLSVYLDPPTSPANICFAVSDNGIGIAKSDIDKLFKPFMQIDSNLNRQQEGTGLGLTLVKQIVELHGGTTLVSSELGQGSCFTACLPYSSIVTTAVNLGEEGIEFEDMAVKLNWPSIAHRQALILLAEDNLSNIETLAPYLESHGYQLLLARDGQQAIDMAFLHRPELILMDIQMPSIDGLEAIRQIRSKPELGQIPIIALTALAMPGDRERCIQAGANHYLSKPANLKKLVEMIATMLTETN